MMCNIILYLLVISPLFALLRMDIKEPTNKFQKVFVGFITVIGYPWIFISKQLVKLNNWLNQTFGPR